MKQGMTKIHVVSASLGLALISFFFLCSLYAEVFGDKATIIQVKERIFYGVWLLIPAMAIAGMTGHKLAPRAKSGLIMNKKKRMPFVAVNGLFILTPAAVFLKNAALSGAFNSAFYTITIQCR